jgi:hypothetical protein
VSSDWKKNSTKAQSCHQQCRINLNRSTPFHAYHPIMSSHLVYTTSYFKSCHVRNEIQEKTQNVAKRSNKLMSKPQKQRCHQIYTIVFAVMLSS